MQYNLLMYPDANPVKGFNMKPISRYLQPDLITCNEMIGQTSIDSLLSTGLDTSIYAAAPWIWDYTIGNALFYNKHTLGFLRFRYLTTTPRRTCIYYMYYKNQDFELYPDTITFDVYVVHLKSSQGSTNELERANQTAAIRNDLANRPRVINTFLNGDFSLYSSNETAYQNLLADGPGQFYDPINRPGSWSNNASFKDIHTQSPRTLSFESGVTGGLDDRFDFILSTEDVLNGTYGLRILPTTYTAVGNDGLHFNQSIIANPTNTSAPDSVIQALHALSDHLPVIVDLEIDPTNAFNGSTPVFNATSCPVWENLQQGLKNSLHWTLTDLSGRIVARKSDSESLSLSKGLYLLESESRIGQKCYQKISVN